MNTPARPLHPIRPADDLTDGELSLLSQIRRGTVSRFRDNTRAARCAEGLRNAGYIDLGLDLIDGGFVEVVTRGGPQK
jgi:hypothetical protein